MDDTVIPDTAPPRLSVVIPTRHRPVLLLRALNSVFAQSYRDFEIIVVIDGPDEPTVQALRGIDDPRLSFIVNPRSLTAAGARNAGVARARGQWVALLDDDDEWFPTKLETQLAFAENHPPGLITCLSEVILPQGVCIWPETIYDRAVPFDEYLFDRRQAFAGASYIQTSSFLLPRGLYEKCAFATSSPHDDWDFVIRLAKEFAAPILTVPEILVKVHAEEQRPMLSHQATWKASLAWVDRLRPILSRRAYSGLCLGVVGPRAAREHAYAAVPLLVMRAFRHGTPRAAHVLAFVAFWVIPQAARRRLRTVFHRGRQAVLF